MPDPSNLLQPDIPNPLLPETQTIMLQFSDGLTVPVVTANTVVLGSGAAGYNAAHRLYEAGQKDVVIVTNHRLAGTSRNTGSDKQTYYKLTLSGSEPDSVEAMAQTLFSGQAMDGDLALTEAAQSVECFLRLCQIGVPFPRNRFGAYVGYKTDHDPKQRATSAGPLTSRLMTEALERQVFQHDIPIYEDCQILDLIKKDEEVIGVLCLQMNPVLADQQPFILFNCTNVVFATGGPAEIYADSVYPHGQWGAHAAAFRAGAAGKNLTEWQYGLASVRPRWNVSGTYQQALPRYISTDQDGQDIREFLREAIPDYGRQLSLIFRKGYEWPFDVGKIRSGEIKSDEIRSDEIMPGSSYLDILVYRETVLRGRRVWLDYRTNPFDHTLDLDQMADEARTYLTQAGAVDGTPLTRLRHMNLPAYQFYKERGIDLSEKPLEIAVCAQHNNGGLAGDIWWQSNIRGLFPVGEANGSHGVYRPGGSALNSGQVGSARAALYIAARRGNPPLNLNEYAGYGQNVLQFYRDLLYRCHVDCSTDTNRPELNTDDRTSILLTEAAARMSRVGGMIRTPSRIAEYLSEIRQKLAGFPDISACDGSLASLSRLIRHRDMLTTQYVYLEAMTRYMIHGGLSRGSALYAEYSGALDLTEVGFELAGGHLADQIQEVMLRPADLTLDEVWRPVRPLPVPDDFFENVWRDYRAHGNILEV